jgi:hypothetical protein
MSVGLQDVGGSPLVRIELFRSRAFAVGVPIAMLFRASYAGFLLLLAVYLQRGSKAPRQVGLLVPCGPGRG